MIQREINTLIIHCSATPNGNTLFTGKLGDKNFSTPVQEIDRWHRAPPKSFRRSSAWRAQKNPDLTSIGYHFVIYTNGAVATGRHLEEIGAHAQGHNTRSLGICLIGTDKFTFEQWQSLRDVVSGIKKSNPSIRVVGHRDLSPDKNLDGKIDRTEWTKTCPGFDVAAWLDSGMAPVAAQIFTPTKGDIA